MCESIIQTANESDTQRLILVNERHLLPFIADFPKDKQEEIWTSIFYRFQIKCAEFKQILERLDPGKGDWKRVSEHPVKSIEDSECGKLLDHPDLKYIESTGDTVRLSVKDGYWIDKFGDGTYSRLIFRWQGDCAFEISFVESNNEVRRSLSKPGDKYVYRILNKGDGYYDMSVEIPNGSIYLFKLYY
jgi:hypothetical protein